MTDCRSLNEQGAALIAVLLISLIVFGFGALAVAVSAPETRVTANFQSSMQAKNFAESKLERIVGLHNNTAMSPRYLFNPSSYSANWPDSAYFLIDTLVAPYASGNRAVGTVQARVTNTNPLNTAPPYTVRATANLTDGSSTTYEVGIDVISLLDFAVYSEGDIGIAPNITIGGRLYAGDDISLGGPNIIFLQRVEYVDNLFNPGFGDFRQGQEQVTPLPALASVVNIGDYETFSKTSGQCSTGIGLYLGFDGNAAMDAQTTALFQNSGGLRPNNQPGCRNGGNCLVVDLGLFDFSVSPVTYNGVPLLGYDGFPLTDFNGVIFADDEVHVWGHLGGRSPEDIPIVDGHNYMTPPPILNNQYSNNMLDTGEDGSGGGTVNGVLDEAGRGTSLGIYGSDNVFIDHNIFTGVDSAGRPARMALVAQDYVRVDSYAPRVIIMETAVLAITDSWRPQSTNSNDQRTNEWANNAGAQPANSHKYDLNGNGVLEGNTGVGQAGDRNENNMRTAWTLRNEGNLVIKTAPSSGNWSAGGHPRYYNYDSALQTAEIPCYPTLPNLAIIPGSFTEVLTEP